MYTGRRKLISSSRAVTTRVRQWRMATTAAAESTSLRMLPPWTLPDGFASWGSMNWLIVTEESATRLAAGGTGGAVGRTGSASGMAQG